MRLPDWWPFAALAVGVALVVGHEDKETRVTSRAQLAHKKSYEARRQTALEKIERAAIAEEERAEKLRTRAEAAPTATKRKTTEAKAATAEKRVERLDDLATRIEGNELSAGELRELMKSGQLRLRNPTPLDLAQRESEEFHCEPDEVRHLSKAERAPLPAEVVVLGTLEDVVYGPDKTSCRGKDLWDHSFGDRGDFAPKAKEKPLLVADPRTRRIAIVQGRSPAKFVPSRGIVG